MSSTVRRCNLAIVSLGMLSILQWVWHARHYRISAPHEFFGYVLLLGLLLVAALPNTRQRKTSFAAVILYVLYWLRAIQGDYYFYPDKYVMLTTGGVYLAVGGLAMLWCLFCRKIHIGISALFPALLLIHFVIFYRDYAHLLNGHVYNKVLIDGGVLDKYVLLELTYTNTPISLLIMGVTVLKWRKLPRA